MKASCEAFIMAVTKLTVEPMLSFITKVTAVKVATSNSSSKRLREQVETCCSYHAALLFCNAYCVCCRETMSTVTVSDGSHFGMTGVADALTLSSSVSATRSVLVCP